MKKLLIGLAAASLFSASAIVLACDDRQDEASLDAAPVAMSKGTASVTAPAVVSKTTKAKSKATAKAPKTGKPDVIASKVE